MEENFFDYNSTTPVASEALKEMLPYFSDCFANPSAQTSKMSWQSQAAINKAKSQTALFLGCKESEITFTSGATESINWAFSEFFKADKNVLVSSIDHDASYESASTHPNGIIYQVNKNGQINEDSFLKACKKAKPKSLINLLLAHNELGTILNLEGLIHIAKKYDHFVHLDATQALGKMDFNFMHSQADLLSCSAHKVYGPKGIGLLVINSKTISLKAFIKGGGQQQNLRSGTLNTPLIVGLGRAFELARVRLKEDQEHYSHLKVSFLKEIKSLNYSLNYDTENSLKNTINITLNNWKSPSPLYLELAPYSVSQGSACSSQSGLSRVLSQIGQENLAGTIRISFGRGSTLETTLGLAAKLNSLLSN